LKRAFSLAVAVTVALASVALPTTFASFTGTTRNASNAYSTTALYAPTGIAASVAGRHVSLSWNNDGKVGAQAVSTVTNAGYTLIGVNNAGTAACPAPNFTTPNYTTSVGTTNNATNTFADARFTPQGVIFCYVVQANYTGSGANWTSLTNNGATGTSGMYTTTGVQLGFVATSVQLINAGNTATAPTCASLGANGASGTAGTLDCGDQFVVTFNQPVNTATGPTSTTTGNDGNTVCTISGTGQIWFASTVALSGAACIAGEPSNLGQLNGGTVSSTRRFSALYSWSNSNKTLTVTIRKNNTTTYPTVSTAVRTFTPAPAAGKLLTANTSDCAGGCTICTSNAGGALCLPTTSSSTFGSPPPLASPTNIRLQPDGHGGFDIAWDVSPNISVAGYEVRLGTHPGRFDTKIDAGLATTYPARGLAPGVAYFVVVVAYETRGGREAITGAVAIAVPVRSTLPKSPPERPSPELPRPKRFRPPKMLPHGILVGGAEDALGERVARSGSWGQHGRGTT
jgi:hypothetical protein